ncbi:hypothetical protein N7532_007891 [Penicillium argentinense]|uniref:Aflatoxin regulatory protein domain-containing protein n=1 Tax=Penicillium argentinense TaxID=1131581 RepID=A0A9W9K1Z8_9EURO|nr:uncharacterized protein N7532_007891 [Penicillium argentinense]KAJ5089207.1 hypothetical protein N7532_007891 [Penicillium argentinense]
MRNLSQTSNRHSTSSWPKQNFTCTKKDKTCTSSILQALQALCIPPTACLSITDDLFTATCKPSPNPNPGQGPFRKMDEALMTNRSIINLASTVLQCPCSATPSVQLLLVTICDRLVAWYRAMMRSEDNFAPVGFMSVQDDDERIVPLPIMIGGFAVDPVIQMRMREQLVCGELGRVEELIRRFAERVQETRESLDVGQGEKIFEILNSLLRDQLRAKACVMRRVV